MYKINAAYVNYVFQEHSDNIRPCKEDRNALSVHVQWTQVNNALRAKTVQK